MNKTVAVLAGVTLSLGGLALTGTAAQATDRGPNYPTAEASGAAGFTPGGTAVTQAFSDVEPGTTVRTVITSCTGTNHTSTQTMRTDGRRELFILSDAAGPVASASFTYSLPGKTDYADPIPVEYNNPKPSSCSGGNAANQKVTSAHIKKWSTKKSGHSKARAGKTAKVTKTYLTAAGKGMKVTYRWTAGSKVIDKDRSVKASRKYVGKKLKLKVTVSKTGYKARSKTLNFGTIKK
jgi:hypothetical protein